ncbi:MAG: HlyD family efflux transporter periplasmic adaptor subunit, partial [Lachnospiraceae bacterium]|nr:HlyD family efflux transporter periplasmic adaptor subunit [Lachnospiraceae bacterium]
TIKKTEYEIKSQEAKIKSLEKATKNSVVKSEMDGIVKSIDQTALTGTTSDEDTGSEESVLMSILAIGDYRVKATVNETNIYSIEEGTPVIIRSRVDSEQTWSGTITTLDSNPETESDTESDYSYDYSDSGDSDGTTTSSNYPFYIQLDNSDGLILGQHVYVEPDNGQDEEKDGIWLDSYYIVQEDESSYVWAESRTGRLEKRTVTLGEYDEELDKYEITDGLTEDDYIAFPTDTLEEGMSTTRDIAEASEADTSVEAEDSTGIIPEEDMDTYEEGDVEDTGGDEEIFDDSEEILDEDESGSLDELEDESDSLDIIEDGSEEPVNEDGSVGSLDSQMEVLA